LAIYNQYHTHSKVKWLYIYISDGLFPVPFHKYGRFKGFPGNTFLKSQIQAPFMNPV